MRKIVVSQQFRFAHHGYQVEEFEASPEPRETTDECADLAISQGWAVAADLAPESHGGSAKRKAEPKAAPNN